MCTNVQRTGATAAAKVGGRRARGHGSFQKHEKQNLEARHTWAALSVPLTAATSVQLHAAGGRVSIISAATPPGVARAHAHHTQWPAPQGQKPPTHRCPCPVAGPGSGSPARPVTLCPPHQRHRSRQIQQICVTTAHLYTYTRGGRDERAQPAYQATKGRTPARPRQQQQQQQLHGMQPSHTQSHGARDCITATSCCGAARRHNPWGLHKTTVATIHVN